MNGQFDYRKCAILYVDDEEKSLKMFSQAFGAEFRILTAPSAAEGFQVLEQRHEEIGLLMSDQRMPGEKGVRFLERTRQAYPHIIRVLATAYADVDAAIDAVNTGAIYKYVTKPWEIVDLQQTLRRGLEFFLVQQERDQLLRERLTALHQMMIADRVIGLGIMAAGLSHHIRNSLVAVRTFLDLAPSKLQQERVNMDQLQSPAYWRGFYDQVQAQLRRITGMLSDLGMASHQPLSPLEDCVRLQEVAVQAVEQAREALETNGIEAVIELPADLPALRGDETKLRRLFELLIKDELVSLPAGSRLAIRGRALPAARGQQEAVLLEVEDNGPGLSPEAVRSVFDPFFTRVDNPQELGISLMACYFIVHHHGGSIEVKSAEGKGTTFLINLPLNPNAQAPALSEQDFVGKALLNNELWERLLAGK